MINSEVRKGPPLTLRLGAANTQPHPISQTFERVVRMGVQFCEASQGGTLVERILQTSELKTLCPCVSVIQS